jgi:tetratricopeptide (TPR) repeat protein
LSNLYEVPFRANPFDVTFVLSAVFVIAVTIATFLTRARWPSVFVAWIAYVALLLPVSGIAHPGGQIVADRYSYLPCLVFALLAGGGMLALGRARQAGRVQPLVPTLASAGAVAILIGLAILTVRQIPVWHDSLALWRHAFDQHPLERLRASGAPAADLRAYEARLAALGELSAHRMIALSLGTALRSAGRQDAATEIFARGASASPSNADIRNSWAATLLELQRTDEAARLLEASIRLDPSHAEAHFNLAMARTSQGRTAEAMESYRRALAIDANNAVARYNLGVLLAADNRLAEAAAEYRHAIAIRPNYGEAYNNLGVALGRQGLVKDAIDAFRKAVTIDPSNASAVKNLARAIEVSKGG